MQKVSAASIEHDLRDMWLQMGSDSGNDQTVTRACIHNLAVYAPGDKSDSELSRILPDLTKNQPGRVILMLPKSETRNESLEAWVTTLCQLGAGKRKQVCCEQIMIRAEGSSIANLPGLVASLLVPDVPAFFWWRSDFSGDRTVFLEFAELADRMIIDSSLLTTHTISLPELAATVRDHRQRTSFTDLNWARLTPWRALLAGLFDHPSCLPLLNQINRVEIQAGSSTVQAILAIAWLATRLNWTLLSHGTDSFSLDAGNRKVETKIESSSNNPAPGIVSVRLFTDNPASELSVIRADGGLKTSVNLQGGAQPCEVLNLRADPTEAFLIANELEILGHDHVYEEALQFASKMLS